MTPVSKSVSGREVGVRVYVDVAFAVNAAVDYLLLLCSARLSGFAARQSRLLCAAGLGGVFAAGSFLWGFLRQPLMGPVMLVSMLLIAYGTGRAFWRQGALFLLVSLALAGLVYLVALFFDQGLILLNRRAYYPVSAPALLITAGFGYLAAQLALQRTMQHTGGQIARVTVDIPAGQVLLSALRDTGNTLRDPLRGTPVLVVEREALESAIPLLTRERLREPMEAFSVLTDRLPELSWRLLPYRVVGGSGLLLAFRATVQVDRQTAMEMTVAVSPTPVSDGGGYQGLLGGEG